LTTPKNCLAKSLLLSENVAKYLQTCLLRNKRGGYISF
jgi:hypothetical protein